MSKAVITGIGMLFGDGKTPEEFCDLIVNGESAISISEMPQYKRKGLNFADSFTKKVCFTAEKAIEDSGAELSEELCRNTGVFLGTSFGNLKSIMDFETKYFRKGIKGITPTIFSNTVMNTTAGQVAISFGFSGMNMTESSGSSAGAEALLCCADMIESGRVDAAVAGGAEEYCGMYGGYMADYNVAVSDGFCEFYIENSERAMSRNADIYCEIMGGRTMYSYDLSSEDVRDNISAALKDAGCTKDDIGMVISCGSMRDIENTALDNLKITDNRIDMYKSTGELYGAGVPFGMICAMVVAEKRIPVLINSVGFDGYISSILICR